MFIMRTYDVCVSVEYNARLLIRLEYRLVQIVEVLSTTMLLVMHVTRTLAVTLLKRQLSFLQFASHGT